MLGEHQKGLPGLPQEQIEVEQPRGYRYLSILGEGGFGTVFHAVQESTGQTVALKMLRLDAGVETHRHHRRIERFERETQLCAELHHPHIVQLLDKGQTAGGRLFAVFEFVPGITLRELLARRGALPALEAGELMGQVLDALACAHARGVVHRDLKPQNIMVSTPGTRPHAKVLDFGIGAFLPATQGVDYKTLTMTQEIIGTPSYTAPEQLRGEPPTIKSDLYAWGLVFLECLTGEPGVRGHTLAEIYHQQLSPVEVALPPAIAGHALGALLRHTLRKDPRNRAEQAAQVYADLRQLNLANLVGNLRQTPSQQTQVDMAADSTLQHEGFGQVFQSERRQITVLCCNVRLQCCEDVEPDLEVLEALDAQQRHQLSLVSDVALQYGGYVAGELGGSVMMYFGYPHVSDDAARRAAKTALELVARARRQQFLSDTAPPIRLELRLGLHTGMVLTRPDSAPSGLTPNIALQLERQAPPDTVLVSETAHQLLAPYMAFAPWDAAPVGNSPMPLRVFSLLGERHSAALSFLRSGQTERPLVGRQAECTTLHQHWSSAKQGQGGSVLLTGEPGIGKSRLAYEAHVMVRHDGCIALDCRCLPEHQHNALYPILDMLQRHLRLSDADSPDITLERLRTALEACHWDMETSMPILCTWFALPIPAAFPPMQYSPNRQKQILLEVLQQLIVNLGGGRPLLLIVEDVHWIDPTSMALLDRLVALAARSTLLLLLTARPEFTAPWPQLQTLSLSRLDSGQVKAMVRQVLDDRRIEDAALAQLSERADGIPLFVEELVHMLRDCGALVERHGTYGLVEPLDAAAIPITLRDMLTARLAALGAARETAQMAAAIGREFDAALLLQASVREQTLVQQDLTDIMAADLAYRQHPTQEDRFVFRHALIRDAAYDGMPRTLREQAHARIAETLERSFPAVVAAHPAVLAGHFASANGFGKAVDYGTRAARSSLQRSLNEETLSHTSNVLAWLQHLDPDAQAEAELDINRLVTQALMGKYGWADARVKASVDRSRELLGQLPGSPHTVPTLWSLATYHHVAGNRAEARVVSDELSAIAEASDDSGLQIAAAAMLGVRYRCDGPLDKAAAILERALSLYDPVQHRHHATIFGLDSRAWAAGTLAIVCWLRGASAEASRHDAEALAWARSLNHVPSLGLAMLQHTLLQHHRGDRPAVQQAAGELLELADKYGLPAYAAYAQILHCWATDNMTQALDVLDTLQAIGCRLAMPFYASLLADTEARHGALSAAIARLSRCLVLCREYDQLNYEPELYRRRAMYVLAAQPSSHAAILDDLHKAATLSRHLGMLRTEAEALMSLLRLGDDVSQQYDKRLRDIIPGCPDLASFAPVVL